MDSSKATEYASQPGTVICNPNLYKIKSQGDVNKLVKIDIRDNGVHRKGFNSRLDTNRYGEILTNYGKKEDSDSEDLVNDIKNTSKNLNREDKLKAAKALNLDKKDLDTLAKDLADAANNNK